MTALPGKPPPKPWPMKWIIVAILVFVAGYTAVNFYFRKPGRAYRPYQDANDRATTARLLAAGWHKLPVETHRPVDNAPSVDRAATVSLGAVGLGLDFAPNFAEPPKLVSSIDSVNAPPEVAVGADYRFHFSATLVDQKHPLGDLTLFRRENELVFVPTTEDLPGQQLMTRWNDSTYAATFSTAALAPGRYSARLVARGPAKTWNFTVKQRRRRLMPATHKRQGAKRPNPKQPEFSLFSIWTPSPDACHSERSEESSHPCPPADHTTATGFTSSPTDAMAPCMLV